MRISYHGVKFFSGLCQALVLGFQTKRVSIFMLVVSLLRNETVKNFSLSAEQQPGGQVCGFIEKHILA